MATDARKHTIVADGDSVDPTAWIGDLSASIRDIIQVDNTTARAAVIDALTAAGIGPSATNPVYVHRTDAPPGRELEVTTDGSAWGAIPSSAAGVVAMASGSVAASVLAAGASGNYPVTFPAGRFSSPPLVFVSSDSSRLSYAAVSITTAGCTVQASNWTAATASPTTVRWLAAGVA